MRKYIVTRITKESIEIEVPDTLGPADALDKATGYDRLNHWEPERVSYEVKGKYE